MSSDGASTYTVACAFWRLRSDGSFWQHGTATRGFQSVSPSSWSVRRKTKPLDSEVRSRTTSAGTRWLVSIRSSWPTRISSAAIASVPPPGSRRT